MEPGPPATALDGSVPKGSLRIDLRGLAGELEAAARANLELQQYLDRNVSPAQLRRLIDSGERQIRAALEPWGYYEAQVRGSSASSGDDATVLFEVLPGPQVLIRSSQVQMAGPAAHDPDVETAIAQFQPRIGQPLDHASYEASKQRIDTTLQNSGYFDASLQRHRVEVTRATRSADIDLAWNGGERYRLGEARFSGAQFPARFLQRYLPWTPDSAYSVDRLLTLQQRLVDADYFSTVSVQPALDERSGGQVPVDVLLLPAKRSVYTAAAYVSTDSGPGARLGAERRWINSRGHKWGAETEYSSRLQATSSNYRIPRPGLRNRYYDFVAGYRDETTGTTRSRLQRVSVSEVLDRWYGYTRTLGLRFLDGDFEVGNERRSSRLLFAEALLARKRADDLMFPKQGVGVSYVLRLAAPAVLSDSSLAQLRADARWVRPAGERSRLILSVAAGSLVASDFQALPPELRFFAGGDRSVRGFDYQAIGERNAAGGVIGGRHLAVLGAEFEYYFLERWGAAAFVDAGDAFSSSLNANVGAGVGLRWKSPVGVVRVDFAIPVRTDLDESGLRIHVIIGPDL